MLKPLFFESCCEVKEKDITDQEKIYLMPDLYLKFIKKTKLNKTNKNLYNSIIKTQKNNYKMGKIFEQIRYQERQLNRKCVKICSTSLVIRKMQIKGVIENKIDNTLWSSECGATRNHIHCCWKCKTVTLENTVAVSYKGKHLFYDPPISSLYILPKKHDDICLYKNLDSNTHKLVLYGRKKRGGGEKTRYNLNIYQLVNE